MLIYDNWCKYDKIMCLLIKVLASLTNESRIFFFTFPKKWVGRAMGNKALNWDGLDKKPPRHNQKKWDAKVFILCSLIAAVPSPVVFVWILQGPSLSSALFGQFRLLKLDHRHHPLRPHSYLQRGTSLINQFLLGKIIRWSHHRRIFLSAPLCVCLLLDDSEWLKCLKRPWL